MDLTNQVFGKLTAVSQTSPGFYLCACSCGGQKEVRESNLRYGITKSCGCLVRGRKPANGDLPSSQSASPLAASRPPVTPSLSPSPLNAPPTASAPPETHQNPPVARPATSKPAEGSVQSAAKNWAMLKRL